MINEAVSSSAITIIRYLGGSLIVAADNVGGIFTLD